MSKIIDDMKERLEEEIEAQKHPGMRPCKVLGEDGLYHIQFWATPVSKKRQKRYDQLTEENQERSPASRQIRKRRQVQDVELEQYQGRTADGR